MKEFQYTLSHREKRPRTPQIFDREEKVEIKGQKVKIVDYIQEAESNDIYYNLDKYGCLDRITVDKEKLFGDFQDFVSLRDIQDKMVKAQNMWNTLPLDVREKFNHDMMQFAAQGEDWLKNEIKKEMKLFKPQKEEKQNIKTDKKGEE